MWRLLDLLFPPRADEAIIRDLSIDDFLSLLSPSLVEETRPGTVALLPFHNQKVRSALHEAKYHGNTHSLILLSTALAVYLADMDERAQKAIILPVPLGDKRHRERGYNQVEEVVRRCLDQNPDLPVTLDLSLLARTRETPSQVSLRGDERRKNICGAFSATHPLDSEYLYIVVDDIITTGATLGAALDALTSAGATYLLPVALAH